MGLKMNEKKKDYTPPIVQLRSYTDTCLILGRKSKIGLAHECDVLFFVILGVDNAERCQDIEYVG